MMCFVCHFLTERLRQGVSQHTLFDHHLLEPFSRLSLEVSKMNP